MHAIIFKPTKEIQFPVYQLILEDRSCDTVMAQYPHFANWTTQN